MTRADFDNLVRNISRKLYHHAYRILRDQEGSEDAVQEVFVKLWKMKSRLEEYKSVDALASTMIKNYCIDQLRKQKHEEHNDNTVFSLLNDTEPSPHEQIERNETFAIMYRIIDDLPEIYREIIRLRDIEELSYEEIAAKTGHNINTLRVTLSRARKTIRDVYKKYNYERRGDQAIT
jgi:RNA polymerase sigma-70 factor (family 1)